MPKSSDQSSSPGTLRPGRGKLVLTLGVLSTPLPWVALLIYDLFWTNRPDEIGLLIVVFSSLSGILAIALGYQELKKINKGVVAQSKKFAKAGILSGILGSFVNFAVLFVVLTSPSGDMQSPKDAVMNDLHYIAANAYQYRRRPHSMKGGAGSYAGYTIPETIASNENGNYEVISGMDSVMITAIATQNPENRITVIVDSSGRLRDWSYFGEFN